METLNLSAPHLSDQVKAREYLEKTRWSNGVECPHCHAIDNHYSLTAQATSKRPVRKGVWKCRKCREQFTVTVGTIFERSHIPLNKWLAAIYLLCSSKKGMSAHQLHRMLGVTYKSAWFMAHRIRHAMVETNIAKMTGIVEADETYVGGKSHGGKRGRGAAKKAIVFSLVERNGNVLSRPVERITAATLKGAIKDNVERGATVMTDDLRSYRGLHKTFSRHEVIRHTKKEYVRGDVHTNTVEGYFSLLKRGINGVYHHVGKNHLHRYLNEFDFRYNARKTSDSARAEIAIIQSKGRRLQYRETATA